MRSGCQWMMLPSDSPKWRTVHMYFAKWSELDPHGTSALERALNNEVGVVCEKLGVTHSRRY